MVQQKSKGHVVTHHQPMKADYNKNMSLCIKWFHWILSEFISFTKWDLVGM
jgi:hypothetical protein